MKFFLLRRPFKLQSRLAYAFAAQKLSSPFSDNKKCASNYVFIRPLIMYQLITVANSYIYPFSAPTPYLFLFSTPSPQWIAAILVTVVEYSHVALITLMFLYHFFLDRRRLLSVRHPFSSYNISVSYDYMSSISTFRLSTFQFLLGKSNGNTSLVHRF